MRDPRVFHVGVSRDFRTADGGNAWGDIGLGALEAAGVPWRYLDRDTDELCAEDLDGYGAVLFAAPAVTDRTFDGLTRPPLLLARFGVGYDSVDLAACTRHGVAVTITPDGARRPVATAALTLLLAARHRLAAKDRLVRTGGWTRRTDWMGQGLTGRRVGLIGLGNTATDLITLLRPFDVEILASDPFRTAEDAAVLGADLVDLDTLMAAADAVIVMAALTPETRHLVDRRRIGLMRRGTTLINIARGPIVEEAALIDALREGHLGAAGLDVFETEPIEPGNPLLSMDNVILSPHAVAWTDEMAIGNGSSAVRAILDVHYGRIPTYLVNPDVLDHPAFKERLACRAPS